MCTAATYRSQDFYFGRTFDYEFNYGEEVVVTPRNYSFQLRHQNALTEHYAMIGIAHMVGDYPLYYDAVNEKGLGMAGLNFAGNAVYRKPKEGRDNIAQAGLLQGQTDIALNAQGLEQAHEAAERLKEVPFEIAFCSPLIRAKRTAETIIGDRKITLTADERLRELNFGPWEGVDIRTIKDAASQPFTNPGSYVPPAGAESFAQLYKRSGEFVDQVLLPLEGTYETVLVVAHGGVNRSILNPVLNIPVDDFWRMHMGNCATAILDCTDGKLSMLEYTDSKSANTKSKLL